jgi:hypothetical protein
VLAAVSGCGGSGTDSAGDYPVVEDPPVEYQPPVTTPNGAVVTKPALPAVYEVEPSASCESSNVNYAGSQRRVVIPPRPGLRAVAVTEHTTRLEWSFDELPDDCSPVRLYLSVEAATAVNATPTVERDVEVSGLSGSKEVTYPDFLPAPDVARASAYLPDGRRSRIATVLIERPANTPPDPPEPIPPVTAPAGEPVTCSAKPTAVNEPAGDVLTYAPGKPPMQVRRMTPALSRIDLTRATVQIDGRTICASFIFARAPTDADFQLSFNLHDTSERSCCTTLRFRRSAGRLEVGAFSIDANGVYQLDPTANAGAALRGTTLEITGDLADPSSWQQRARRMPAVENLAWSITTGYFPDKYGPYFGDWLPRHEPIGQPAIRHSDGAVVRPGS